MWTPCAKHVVVKAASNAAIASVNFMVVAIGESLELIETLYITKKQTDKNNIDIEGDVITFLFFKARGLPADVDDYRLVVSRASGAPGQPASGLDDRW